MKLDEAGPVGQVLAGNVVVVAATMDVLGSADHAAQDSEEEEELEEVEVVVGSACQELELLGSLDHGPQEVVEELLTYELDEELDVLEIEYVTLELVDEMLTDQLDEELDDEAELVLELALE